MTKKRSLLTAAALFVAVLSLYRLTAAGGIVPGDPTEYTFVGYLLGIAHPPGYAFMTLLTKLWQTIVPFGNIAQRSHWLAGAAGALSSTLVFGILWQIGRKTPRPGASRPAGQLLPALLAGLTVAVAADQWQHSIHVNSHIITMTLNATALFLLTRWWLTGRDKWLYAFCVIAGIGPTHHPLTVFSFPAYALFIIAVRPEIIQVWRKTWWQQGGWRTLLSMLLFGLLGLAVWLYYPIRSPMEFAFGAHDMNTLDGFLNVALARGLRVNLFHFGLADQGQRLLVFWTLLRQQFTLPIIALALVGLGWLARKQWRLLVLLGLALLVNLAFVINTVQDVMAYLLTPFMLIGILSGVGALALVTWIRQRQPNRWAWVVLWVGLLIWPALTLSENAPRISLRDYRAGDEYIAAVEARFAGREQAATLLNDWEHMTPLWYDRYVNEQWPDPADVTPSLVSTDRPWLERVFEHLPAGPVYLSGYRREIVDAGFRLRPDGVFYQVVEPGDTSLPADFEPLEALSAEPIELLGYQLAARDLPAGNIVALDLAMRAPITPTDYLVPYAQLGDLRFNFTTDSHLLTPWWRANEVIVERFQFALPLDMAPGRYPLAVGLVNLSAASESAPLPLGDLTVSENPAAPSQATLDGLLANFGQRVGVNRVSVRAGGERRSAIWDEPIELQRGDSLALTIDWRCLAPIEESYTVFVHLIDAGNQVWDQQDYTPLGGSTPTHLWIPKWLPGQTALDPYRLTVPANAPAGQYYVEIGLYSMTSRQRIYQYDRSGNLVGDRLVLGPIQVR